MSEVARSFENLYPREEVVVCRLCTVGVSHLATHLEVEHPELTLDLYRAAFPDAATDTALSAAPEPDEEGIAPRVANAHPGGRDGALIERSLPEAERRGYRDDLRVLVEDQKFPRGYSVATIAYHMALARRIRKGIEDKRGRAPAVFPAEDLEILNSIEGRIGAAMRDMEKLKVAARVGEDPIGIVERELESAEAWVHAHQGEFVESCPSCQAPITPPALPHWAYAPVETPDGQQWMVWSAELWRLVTNGVIPLWVMAFVLRTSPEGLKRMAERRGETWPETINLEAHEHALRQVLDAQDLERWVSGAPTVPVAIPATLAPAEPSTQGSPTSGEPAPSPAEPTDDLPSPESL